MELYCSGDINTGRQDQFADLGQNLSYVVRKRDHILLYTQWSMDNDFEVAWSDNGKKNRTSLLRLWFISFKRSKKHAST